MKVNALAKEIVVDYGSNKADANLVQKAERLISDVFAVIAGYHPWSWRKSKENITLATPTAQYSLSTSAMDITSARIISVGGSPGNIQLTYRPLDEIIIQASTYPHVSQPREYGMSGFDAATSQKKVTFWPTPDQAYTVEAHTELQIIQLGSTSDIPVPLDFITLIRFGTKELLAKGDLSPMFYMQLEAAATTRSNAKAHRPKNQLSDILEGEGEWPPRDYRFS